MVVSASSPLATASNSNLDTWDMWSITLRLTVSHIREKNVRQNVGLCRQNCARFCVGKNARVFGDGAPHSESPQREKPLHAGKLETPWLKGQC